MILNTLSLDNYRVFQGQHEIDLAPRSTGTTKKPIILFGGLNGAGKTSILSAIRLVLFGRQSLGHSVTQKSYDAYLATSIHHTEDDLLASFSARISLSFSYASQGTLKEYKVTRSWISNINSTVEEGLTIEENGFEIPGLKKDQCQGFLNELIPIGVADLFFFDGEKISELAEDTQGSILGDAIKRMLGLDLLDTLHGDLGIILRSKSKNALPSIIKEEITAFEKQLAGYESAAEEAHSHYEQMNPVVSSAQFDINQLNDSLLSRGGAWAKTRKEETNKLDSINANIAATENVLRDLLSSNYPFAIAADYTQKVLTQLKTERASKRKNGTADLINTHLNSLQTTLKGLLDQENLTLVDETMRKEFAAHTLNDESELIHDISDSALSFIESAINDAIGAKFKKVNEVKELLSELRHQQESSSNNVARAPVEAVLKPILNEIHDKETAKAEALKKQTQFLEQYRSSLRDAISVTRKLDKLTEEAKASNGADRSLQYASKARVLLKEFSTEVAKQKVKQLEEAFAESFSRLARKGDMALRAKISHIDFSVKLVSNTERDIDKNELSAGEKQIYAISILEALAKTSGRHLPVIIDTPLGRLDSVHRTHLVNQYFPNASHQVVILSTDTEVDEHFYSDLSEHISHAYRLEYSTEKGSTVPVPGYFWESQEETSSHVA